MEDDHQPHHVDETAAPSRLASTEYGRSYVMRTTLNRRVARPSKAQERIEQAIANVVNRSYWA